jgi:hypothetical protein
VAGSYLLGAQGMGSVHVMQKQPKIVGNLLSTGVREVSFGNHFALAAESIDEVPEKESLRVNPAKKKKRPSFFDRQLSSN